MTKATRAAQTALSFALILAAIIPAASFLFIAPVHVSASRTADQPPASNGGASAKPKPHVYAGFVNLARNGFGDTQNAYAWSMAWFKGKLYVGTSRNNLCNASVVAKDPWARRVTACPSAGLSADSRAEIWAYTPETNSWQMVYRSPMANVLIQGFLLRVPRDVGYRSMAVFTDRNGATALYIGTTAGGDYAELLYTTDGIHFNTVGHPGLGIAADTIRALTPFNGKLYVAPIGSSTQYYSNPNRDEVFASDDPASGRFTSVSNSGFGDPANGEIYDMAVFNGQLYAAISNNRGFQLWRSGSSIPTPSGWTAVLVDGAYRGQPSPTATTLAVFNGKLYVGSANETIGIDNKLSPPSEIIAVNPDDTWDLIMGDARQTAEGYKSPLSGYGAGFNNRYSAYLWKMAVHDGWLYAGTYDWSTFNIGRTPVSALKTAGFDLYKTHDGVHWVVVDTKGFGNPYNYGVRTMLDTPLGLFLGTANPFAGAPDGDAGAEIWLMPSPNGENRPHGVALNNAACPMAHCSPHINGNINMSLPTSAAKAVWRTRGTGVGFRLGIGCSVGTSIVVCDGTNTVLSGVDYSAGYVEAFDFQGHLLWDSRRLLGSDVVVGAPLIDAQDNSYMSDSNWIVSFTRDGVVRWQTPNPAGGGIVSLNMTSSGYLVGQAGLGATHGLIMAINPQTGAIAGTLELTDSLDGHTGDWGTKKTDSVVGNRIYTATQFVPASSNYSDPNQHGRLYAIDVDANGHLHVAWYFSYKGPTGGSPDVLPGAHNTIFFDGTGPTPNGDPAHVWVFAVQDNGPSGSLLWQDDLTQQFSILYPQGPAATSIQTAPVHDPHGGIWLWAEQDGRIIRLDEHTGAGLDSISIPTVTGDPSAGPEGTMEIAANGSESVMLVGILAGPGNNNSVAAIDLATHKLLWTAPLGSGASGAAYGQYPVAPNPSGGALLFVPTYDGTLYGFSLS